jgi:DNA-binding IscR family transcriptional regulator
VAFYKQHPESLVPERRGFRLSNRLRERAALLLMFRIGELFYARRQAPSLDDLSVWLNIPTEATQRVLDSLLAQRLVVEAGVEPAGYLPALDLGRLPLADLLQAVRTGEEDRQLNSRCLPAVPVVDEVIAGLRLAMEESLGQRTLRDLITRSAEENVVPQETTHPDISPSILSAPSEPVIHPAHVGGFDQRGSG